MAKFVANFRGYLVRALEKVRAICLKIVSDAIIFKFKWDHGRPQGGARGALPSGIRHIDVIYCRPTKYPKIFARAIGARHR